MFQSDSYFLRIFEDFFLDYYVLNVGGNSFIILLNYDGLTSAVEQLIVLAVYFLVVEIFSISWYSYYLFFDDVQHLPIF